MTPDPEHPMKTRTYLAPAVAALALVATGCASTVYSPPAEFAPLDAPATLADGEHALGFEGGASARVFGPDIVTGSARYRHGLDDGLELDASGSVAWVLGDAAEDTFRGILAGRVGLKGNVVAGFPHFSWLAGVGGGGSAGGGFASADGGLILGYENPYVVPFWRLRVFTSVPIDATDVDITRADADPEEGPVIDRPHVTFGVGSAVGVKVPVGRAELYLGLTATSVHDVRGEDDVFVGFSGGLNARF